MGWWRWGTLLLSAKGRHGVSGTMRSASRFNALVIRIVQWVQAERMTILVVEDEAHIRMVSADILEEGGFRVLEAANAAEAILILEGADHVELMFGRMEGLELAAFVHEHWSDVRLLVTSGHIVIADSEIPDGGLFVSKPYNLKRLVAEIPECIAGPPPSNQTAVGEACSTSEHRFGGGDIVCHRRPLQRLDGDREHPESSRL